MRMVEWRAKKTKLKSWADRGKRPKKAREMTTKGRKKKMARRTVLARNRRM